MSFAQKRPSSAGSSRRPVSRASSRGTNRRPMSAGSSRSRASSRNSIIDQYDNAVASKRRELLVKLLQRETMKEAMFKDMQLRKGGGIMPTEEVDDKARQMAEDLVNGNVDILTEELLNQIGTEREVDDNGRKDARPPVPPLRLDTAAVKAEKQNATIKSNISTTNVSACRFKTLQSIKFTLLSKTSIPFTPPAISKFCKIF